jgi:hypothetical protein
LVELFEVRSELNLALLSDLIFVKSLKWFGRLLQYFSVVINHKKPSFFLKLFLGILDLFYRQFPDFIVFGFEKAVGIVLESYFLGRDINLVLLG